jgi:hypothetical protein
LVTVTFTGQVPSGAGVGIANFSGVDQTTPLGTPVGVGSVDSSGQTPTVTLTGLSGNELVFDTVFMGTQVLTQTITPGSGQTMLWNTIWIKTHSIGSISQASSSSVTMSWTANSTGNWAIAAVPINPVPDE